MLILDSGAVSQLSKRSRHALALIVALREEGLWPPTVPAVVLVECLQGHAGRDANENRFLKTCDIGAISEALARRAALLRRMARRGSAVDALECCRVSEIVRPDFGGSGKNRGLTEEKLATLLSDEEA